MSKAVQEIVADLRKADMLGTGIDAGAIADRIDAAAKRVVVSKTETTTVGNAAAMRETLAGIRALIADEPDGTPMIDAMKATIDVALSAPARQCDVGTAEEQTKRFRRFCDNTKCQYCNITFNKGSCSFNWAQTPYAENGGASGR